MLKFKNKMEITPWIAESHDLETGNLAFEHSLSTVEKYGDLFAFLMPCTLGCTEDGSVVDGSKHNGRLKKQADKKNLPLFPLLAGDHRIVNKIILDKNIKHRHILQIVDYVNKHNLKGIDVDYEFLPLESRYAFTDFVKELADELHKNGRMLSIDLHPKVRPDDAWSIGARAQDWLSLSQYADILHIMCYDQYHFAYAYNDPGPVSTAAWTEAVVVYASSVIPPEKLVIGLPTYATDWNLNDKSKTINLFYSQVMALTRKYNADIKLNEIMKQPFFHYFDEANNKHEVWFEDVQSLSAKFDVIAKYPIRGLAFWALTLEDPRIWDELRRRLV